MLQLQDVVLGDGCICNSHGLCYASRTSSASPEPTKTTCASLGKTTYSACLRHAEHWQVPPCSWNKLRPLCS